MIRPFFAGALNAEIDVYATAAIRLLLLTCCRKTELLRARWDRLDLETRRLLLEDTKTGEPKIVPLSAPTMEIVRSLPRMLHSPWIFPSPKDQREPREDIERAWERIREAARVHDATIHDLRRTRGVGWCSGASRSRWWARRSGTGIAAPRRSMRASPPRSRPRRWRCWARRLALCPRRRVADREVTHKEGAKARDDNARAAAPFGGRAARKRTPDCCPSARSIGAAR
ncbi:MAG: site-specific integrase [Gemmatimonadetes bacterium]|nr:site-specific integrase [Gemmatimonadota bacterium]